MPAAEKYAVLFAGTPITKKTRRRDAHRLRESLGPQYRVWNYVTRRESYN